MPSTYSNLKFELIAPGEQAGTWGSTTNTNIGTAVEEAITGSADITFSSADVTLTLDNSNASQAARNLRLNLVGTSGGARNLILGAGCQINKQYIVRNNLADAVTIRNTTGTGISIPAGEVKIVFNDGTNVTDASPAGGVSNVTASAPIASSGGATPNISLTGTVPIANGGTGQTGTPTNGQLLIGNGSGFTRATLTAGSNVTITNAAGGITIAATTSGGGGDIPAGTSMMFVQTSAPTGWTKSTAHNNKALRVVSGTASSGGSVAFTTAFASQSVSGSIGNTTADGTVGSTTLVTTQLPVHAHNVSLRYTDAGGFTVGEEVVKTSANGVVNQIRNTGGAGSSAGHNHTFSGTSHSHTFSGTAINLAVQYVDVIIATKN